MLGLQLQLDGERLRFWAGTALLLEPEEMNERLRGMLDGAQRRADEEVRRREEAERRLAEPQGELERLKARGE